MPETITVLFIGPLDQTLLLLGMTVDKNIIS